MKKVLIYGIGSYKNRGVEAIVQSALKQMPQNNKVDVACYDVDYNKKKYKDKIDKYINHRIMYEELPLETREEINGYALQNDFFKIESIYQREVINELDKYDICVSAGGDNYCYGANDWLFTMDRSVKMHNKKLVLFGASLYEKIEDDDLIRNLDLFDVLHIRETISYNELKKYISEDKLILAPDPAFSLEPKKVTLDKWYKGRKVIGINVSPTVIGKDNKEERLQDIIKFIRYILDKTDYSISLISHVTIEDSNDYKVSKQIYEAFENEDRIFLEKDDYDCNQVKYVISKCDLMIVARTHASIAAYSSYVPTLVLGYSVKSKGIAKDIFGTDKNYVIPFSDLNYNNLITKFNWLNSNQNKIKTRLKEVIPEMIEKSSHSFEQILEKIEEQEKKTICDRKQCINCGLCSTVCPNDAVVEKEDALHFKYKEKDIDKCVNCKLCEKKCPVNSGKIDNNKSILKCYAAKNKDIEVQKNSSSGGIFTLLANEILKNHGVVYGATREENITQHIRITDEKDLYKIRGSKYTQSTLTNVLDDILKDNKKNKKILFSGTPCQVAAVRRLLGESKNITYVSVVCHGVLNDDLVNKYLNERNLNLLSFKTKENGWSKSSIKYDQGTRKFMDDELMGLYIYNDVLRESCYNCKFTLNNSKADIILGDYWGIDEIDEEMFDENGVSAVIILTKNGSKLFSSIKSKTICKETSIDHLEKRNPCLIKSPTKPRNRFIMGELINNNSWELIYSCEKMSREISKSAEEILQLKKELSNKNNEIDRIKNSKRWKFINSKINLINKILRRTNKGEIYEEG